MNKGDLVMRTSRLGSQTIEADTKGYGIILNIHKYRQQQSRRTYVSCNIADIYWPSSGRIISLNASLIKIISEKNR